MTISQFGSGLNAIEKGPPFVHFSWDPAPDTDFGVYAEEDESLFRSDNRHSEKTTLVYVNLYTRDDTGATKDKIETYFNSLMNGENTLGWYVNTIQYEDETRFIHVEWIVEFA